MNGYECGQCGCEPCICAEIEQRKEKQQRIEEGYRAKKLLRDFEDATNELFKVLMRPKRVRQRLLRWLYPELRNVANSLRKYYWFKDESVKDGVKNGENV